VLVSLGGPPPSTLADVLRYVVALWAKAAELASGPPFAGLYTAGHAYSAGDIISSSAVPFVCFAAGTAVGAGPSGTGSASDVNGVGWRPLIFVGERYEQAEGAPPRIFFVPDKTERAGPILEISARQIASRTQGCDVYVWGSETVVDTDRYDAADALLDEVMSSLFDAAAGRVTWGQIDRQAETSIVTFGEELLLHFDYARLVPRSDVFEAAAAALALTSQSPSDPDRPFGGNGLTPVVQVITQETR
jgi:hypothetical protein